jgi:hypothetical protein
VEGKRHFRPSHITILTTIGLGKLEATSDPYFQNPSVSRTPPTPRHTSMAMDFEEYPDLVKADKGKDRYNVDPHRPKRDLDINEPANQRSAEAIPVKKFPRIVQFLLTRETQILISDYNN